MMKTSRPRKTLWWTRNFGTAPKPQQQPQPQIVEHEIPPEFPGVVYDALRAFPDAMAAVDKAAQEFYARREQRR
jgi:hypothetical protein